MNETYAELFTPTTPRRVAASARCRDRSRICPGSRGNSKNPPRVSKRRHQTIEEFGINVSAEIPGTSGPGDKLFLGEEHRALLSVLHG